MRIKSFAISLLAGSLLTVGCAKDKQEETITLDRVPSAARAGIDKQLAGAAATKVERETKHGKTVYEVQTLRDGKKAEFKVGEDGMLVGKEKMKGGEHEDADDEKDEHDEHDGKGEGHHAKAGDDAKIKEADIDVAKLPDAVTRAVAETHPGSKITAAEIQTAGSVTAYEVDVQAGSEHRELQLTSDGKIERDDVEKDEKNEKK